MRKLKRKKVSLEEITCPWLGTSKNTNEKNIKLKAQE